MPDHSFSRNLRLLKSTEFDEVFDFRCSAGDSNLVLYGKPNELGHPRLGLVVSRKVGPAVVRNQWKRAIREVFRQSQHSLPAVDLVCIPKSGATANVARLMESLPKLVDRLVARIEKMRTASKDQTPIR